MGKTYRYDGMADRDIRKARSRGNVRQAERYTRNDRRNAKAQIEDALNLVFDDNHELCDNSPCVDCQMDNKVADWYNESIMDEMERDLMGYGISDMDYQLDYDYSNVRDICEGCQSHKLDCICHTF